MRPTGQLPLWATDGNYPAGINPWNGQPTKVDPGLTKRDEGFEPAEQVPAEWVNFELNAICTFLDMGWDVAEVQNWTPKYQVKPGANVIVPIGFAGKCFCYNTTTGQFFYSATGTTGPGSGSVFMSYNGIDWTDESGSLASGGILPVANATSTISGLSIHASVSKNQTRTAGGAYANLNLTGGSGGGGIGSNGGGIAYDTFTDSFVWFGTNTTPHPAIWVSAESPAGTIAAPVAQTLQNSASYVTTSAVTLFAASTSRKVAVMTDAATGNQHFFDTAAYGSTWTDRGVNTLSGGGVILALHYNRTNAKFMCLTSTGRAHTSTDGITWTVVSDNSSKNWVYWLNCLESHGGIWIAAVDVATVFSSWVYSVDDGVTWNNVALSINPLASVETPNFLRAVDDRIVTVSSLGNISYSYRLK